MQLDFFSPFRVTSPMMIFEKREKMGKKGTEYTEALWDWFQVYMKGLHVIVRVYMGWRKRAFLKKREKVRKKDTEYTEALQGWFQVYMEWYIDPTVGCKEQGGVEM